MVLSEVVVFVREVCVGLGRFIEGVVGVVMGRVELVTTLTLEEFSVVLACEGETEAVFVM